MGKILISFTLSMVVISILMSKYMMKDYVKFFLTETKLIFKFEKFRDLGHVLSFLFVVVIISLLGVLLSRVFIMLLGYILTGDLISWFTASRGVFLIGSDHTPFTLPNLLTGFALPMTQYASVYMALRTLRDLFLWVNKKNPGFFSEGSMIYFGSIVTMLMVLINILLFTQPVNILDHPLSIFNTILISQSNIALFIYFGTILHITSFKRIDKSYVGKLPEYVQMKKWERYLCSNPITLMIVSILTGNCLDLPRLFGIQFLSNPGNVCVCIIFILLAYYVINQILSKGYNFTLTVMLKTHSALRLSEYKDPIWSKIRMSILILGIVFGSIGMIIKPRIFIFALLVGIVAPLMCIIFTFVVYLLGRGLSFVIAIFKGLECPDGWLNFNWRQCFDRLFQSILHAIVSIFLIFFIFFTLVALFPKKLHYDKSLVAKCLMDQDNNIIFFDPDSTYGQVLSPINEQSIPKFYQTILSIQEDRSFFLQKDFISPSYRKSNWHGFSLRLGSNLNHQLIKNLAFPDMGFPQDISRKIAEQLSGFQLSDQLTTAQILNYYTNTATFNGSFYKGVNVACQEVFGRPINEANNLEQAYLVKSIQRSSSFRIPNENSIPYKDAPDNAVSIKKMLLERAKKWKDDGLISIKDYSKMSRDSLRFSNGFHFNISPGTRLFFKKELLNLETSAYQTLFSKKNEIAIKKAAKRFDKHFSNVLRVKKNNLYYASVVVNVKTGDIIGHFSNAKSVDLADFGMGYSVGSTIKPLILLQMLENGVSTSLYDGEKGAYVSDDAPFLNKYVDLETIIPFSLNAPMVNIRERVNPLNLFKNLEDNFLKMGMRPDPTLDLTQYGNINCYALGQSRHATLLDWAQAYQTVFNDGKSIPLHLATKKFDVTSNLYKKINYESQQIWEASNCTRITNAMAHISDKGATGHYLKVLLPNNILCGKTGTTQNAKFGWIILCINDTMVVSCVCYGREKNDHLNLGTLRIPSGSGAGSAGILAAYIYQELFK